MKIGILTTKELLGANSSKRFLECTRSIMELVLWDDLIEFHFGAVKEGDLCILISIRNTNWLSEARIVVHPSNTSKYILNESEFIKRFNKKYLKILEAKESIERDNDIFEECDMFFLFTGKEKENVIPKGRLKRFYDKIIEDENKIAFVLYENYRTVQEINMSEESPLFKKKKELMITFLEENNLRPTKLDAIENRISVWGDSVRTVNNMIRDGAVVEEIGFDRAVGLTYTGPSVRDYDSVIGEELGMDEFEDEDEEDGIDF